MRVLSFLALAGFTFGQSCVQNSTCFSGICQSFDFCACASGVTGLDCSVVSSVCPGQWANVSQLATDNYPTLDTTYSGVRQGNLKIRLTSPLVSNRLSSVVYLADPLLYPACAFGNWSKSILSGSCSEEYDLDMAWTTAVDCGFVLDNGTPGFQIYRNNIYVKHHDLVSVFRGTPVYRETIHTFPVELKFKTRVEVSTSVSIFAPVNLLAAITRQTYDIPSQTGILEFTTSLQWPFELSGASINGIPVQLSANLSSVDVACSQTVGEACTQRYTLSIDPGVACELTGDYALVFTLICRGDQTLFPLDPQTVAANVAGSVNSENFCTGLAIDIGLTGSLSVYGDAAYSLPKTAYLAGQVAYFRAALSTDNTATITSSTISEVRINDGTTTKYLRQNGNNVADGTSVGLADVSASPANAPAFSLTPNNNVFVVPVDEQVQYTVTAVIMCPTLVVPRSASLLSVNCNLVLKMLRLLLRSKLLAPALPLDLVVMDLSLNPSSPLLPLSSLLLFWPFFEILCK